MKNLIILFAITALDVVNKFNCAIAARKGTGSKHCSFKEGVPKTFWLSRRGFDYGTIVDLTAEGIAKEIQRGNINPFPMGFGFERLTEANTVETSNLGLSSLARKGIYKYRFTWDRDDTLQAVLASYDSNDIYDYVAIDSKGNMKLTKNGNTITGASVGLLDTDPFTEADGSVSGKVGVMIELNNPQDYNQFAAYFSQANLPFRPEKVEGINDIDLTLTAFAAAASEISFTAFLKDGTTAFQGGLPEDFKVLVNGTLVAANGIVEREPGFYTATVPAPLAAADVIKLSTWDAVESTVAIIKDGVTVYRGSEVTEVVA